MMTMRVRGLLGLASRVPGAKAFSTEIFVSMLFHVGRLLRLRGAAHISCSAPQVQNRRKCSCWLSFYTTEEEFKNTFSPFGAVEEVRLVRDNQTGRPKGFGFVKYSSQAAAEKAVKAMDGRIIRGRLIFVEAAKERDDTG